MIKSEDKVILKKNRDGVITFIWKEHGHVVTPKNYIFTQNVLENAFGAHPQVSQLHPIGLA